MALFKHGKLQDWLNSTTPIRTTLISLIVSSFFFIQKKNTILLVFKIKKQSLKHKCSPIKVCCNLIGESSSLFIK